MSNLLNPEYYYNRELSWIDFNNRVLYEASEDRNPLLERLKFISIVSSNLEEFYSIRVAAIRKQEQLGILTKIADQLTPRETLKGIRSKVLKLFKKQYDLFYNEIYPQLKESGVHIILDIDEIQEDEEYLSSFFEHQLVKVLTPISVGPSHPFPKLISGRLYLAVELEADEDRSDLIERSTLSFIEVPTNIYGRFIKIENEERYIPLGVIVKRYASRLYNGYKIKSKSTLRISRDADFSIETDAASDLLKEIETQIKMLHKRSAVKLEYETGMPDTMLKTLMDKLLLPDEFVFEIHGLLNLRDLMDIYLRSSRTDLKDRPLTPIYPSVVKNRDIFELISEQDILLFHPYQSYDPIVELLTRAAEDKDVLAIKMILYRTSSDSGIIKALIRAAENGKYVTCVDELKARFDEKRNIKWAKQLEESGAHVIYGISDLKTHAKALMIVRQERYGVKRYCHLATGNYNETTAKLYTDFSLFTSNDYIGEDISTLFNLLTGFSIPMRWNYIAVAPLNLRDKVIALIKRETENAKSGMKAKIVAKMNSLLDQEVIKTLYEASNAGVKIDLIVRGICALKPGIPEVSENITVRSIVGKYLEHARIFYFYNGGEEEYFLSSADWMPRNLNLRVELLFPVLDKKLRKFIDTVLHLQFDDTMNVWMMDAECHYKPTNVKNGKHDSFSEIYEEIKREEKKLETKEIEIIPIKSPKGNLD